MNEDICQMGASSSILGPQIIESPVSLPYIALYLTHSELEMCKDIAGGIEPHSFVRTGGRHLRLSLSEINDVYRRYLLELQADNQYEDLTRLIYFKLKTLEGFSQVQAANILGISKSTVNRRYMLFLKTQGKKLKSNLSFHFKHGYSPLR